MVSAATAGRAAAGGRIIDGGGHRFGVVVECHGFVTFDGYKKKAILARQELFLSPTMELKLLTKFTGRAIIMHIR